MIPLLVRRRPAMLPVEVGHTPAPSRDLPPRYSRPAPRKFGVRLRIVNGTSPVFSRRTYPLVKVTPTLKASYQPGGSPLSDPASPGYRDLLVFLTGFGEVHSVGVEGTGVLRRSRYFARTPATSLACPSCVNREQDADLRESAWWGRDRDPTTSSRCQVSRTSPRWPRSRSPRPGRTSIRRTGGFRHSAPRRSPPSTACTG